MLCQKPYYFWLLYWPYANLRYYHLDQMSNEIADDPSQVKAVFEELRMNFKLNVVQEVSFREKALEQLMQGYKEMQA